jgi:hypothetical protein
MSARTLLYFLIIYPVNFKKHFSCVFETKISILIIIIPLILKDYFWHCIKITTCAVTIYNIIMIVIMIMIIILNDGNTEKNIKLSMTCK